MYHYPNRLPVFGDGHFLNFNADGTGSCYTQSGAYDIGPMKGNQNAFIAGAKNFKLNELEVFAVTCETLDEFFKEDDDTKEEEKKESKIVEDKPSTEWKGFTQQMLLANVAEKAREVPSSSEDNEDIIDELLPKKKPMIFTMQNAMQ